MDKVLFHIDVTGWFIFGWVVASLIFAMCKDFVKSSERE